MTRSRRQSRTALAALLAAAVLGGVMSPAARAELGPIELVSKTAKEQANYAREAALSGNGNYVAFVGELGGRSGLFRKNLGTGALTLVVPGAVEAPSIAAEGNVVSFTTRQSLEPVLDPGGTTNDVYVANLTGAEPAYQLASATEGHRMPGESSAAPRVALSADGTEVAFVDGGQVYVRRLGEEAPILITTRRDRATGEMTSEPVVKGGALSFAGAALSADGNAVAWVGEHLPEQVPLPPGEEASIATIEQGPIEEGERRNRYFEPLWRSIPTPGQEGPLAEPTRRIVGGDEPGLFPKLDENHAVRSLPGYEGFGWGINLPQLSADGLTVAAIGSPDDDNDLFVVNMTPGLSRAQAVRRLTRWTNPLPADPGQEKVFERPEYLSFTGPIKQCAISANGRYVAFTTQRQSFPLAPPTLITPRPSVLPTVVELYQVDLLGGTFERITPGPGQGVSAASALQESSTAAALAGARYGEAPLGASGPSFSADGLKLAFASKAYNYVNGDANEESDVFTVATTPPAPVEESKISPRPSALSVIPSWKLTVHAVSRPNGAIRIVAGVPGAGTVEALAKSRVGSTPKARQVSTGSRRAGAAGIVRLELRLPPKLRKLASRKGGLYAALDIQFDGAGGRPLQQQIVARFRVHSKQKPKGGKR